MRSLAVVALLAITSIGIAVSATADSADSGSAGNQSNTSAKPVYEPFVPAANLSPAPEPGTLMMVGGGLFALFGVQRMRNRQHR